MSQESRPSFVAGFSLGLFSGVLGYFLFGTERGQKVRAELSQHWAEAQAHLKEEGVLETEGQSLREFFEQLKNEILAGLEIDSAEFEFKEFEFNKKHKKKRRLSLGKKEPEKFKGI